MNPAENPDSAADTSSNTALTIPLEIVSDQVTTTPQDPRDATAAKIVQNHVLWSLSAGLIPLPVADIAAVTAVQMDALKQLATLYGVDYTEDHGKRFVAALSGGALARVGASAVKAIPGVGTLLGGLGMSAMSGASTYAVCQVALHHFKTDGNFLNVPVDKAKGLYQDLLAKGKQFVQEVKGGLANHQQSQEVTASLQELLNLKSKGLLTEEEYEAKKSQLLDRLES
jgi:uncharacterized protein (DUF697 family)